MNMVDSLVDATKESVSTDRLNEVRTFWGKEVLTYSKDEQGRDI